MKIYLAARYSRRAELATYAEALTADGHEIVGRWLAGEHEIGGDQVLNALYAIEDWEDLHSADAVISFTEPPRTHNGRGGRHVEFGIAMALGKKLFLVGPREHVFHWLPGVVAMETFADLRNALLSCV